MPLSRHDPQSPKNPARAHYVAGHFGEWVQGLYGTDQTLALVTMACPALSVTAIRMGDGDLRLDQEPFILTHAQAETLLTHLDLAPQGQFRLCAQMPPGGGAGASTAALVAFARAAGAGDSDLRAACLAVEGASDPLMLAQPDGVLWASREGRVLAHLARPPRCEVIGGFWGQGQRTDPTDFRFPDISDLIADWQKAGADLARYAAIASASATRSGQLRGPAGDPMPDLVRDLGALGHVRAHTGSARGLIFAQGTVPHHAGASLRQAGLTGVIRFLTGAA